MEGYTYKPFDQEPWKSHGYRILTVDAYLVLYRPIEELGRIDVTDVIHSSRDIVQVLRGKAR